MIIAGNVSELKVQPINFDGLENFELSNPFAANINVVSGKNNIFAITLIKYYYMIKFLFKIKLQILKYNMELEL